MAADEWDWKDWGEVDGLVVNGGAGNKSKGIETNARTIARFGHLMLNRGRWVQQQVLSAEWVDQATSVQVSVDVPIAYDALDSVGPGSYGFNWWVNGVKPNGSRQWPDAPPKTYTALGAHLNFVTVIPEWQMVIVRLGTTPSVSALNTTLWNGFLKRVGESLKD